MKFIIAIIIFLCPIFSVAASFDCQKANSKVEHIICDNPGVSDNDYQLSILYKNALKRIDNPEELIADQRIWLTSVRDLCEDMYCVHSTISRRMSDLVVSKNTYISRYNKIEQVNKSNQENQSVEIDQETPVIETIPTEQEEHAYQDDQNVQDDEIILLDDESLINSEKINAELPPNHLSNEVENEATNALEPSTEHDNNKVENEATNALESLTEHDNNKSERNPFSIIISVIIGLVLFASGVYHGRRKSPKTEKGLQRNYENNTKKLIDEPAHVEPKSEQAQPEPIQAQPEPIQAQPEPITYVEPETNIPLPIKKVNLESSIRNNSANKSKIEKIETTVLTKLQVKSNHKIKLDLPKNQNIEQTYLSIKESQEQFKTPAFKYKLEIFEGDCSKLSVPLSFSTLANLISNVSDSDVNNDLYLLAANHPSVKVRESVAMKDNLSSDIVSVLLKNSSIAVLRLLVNSDAFKSHVKKADLSRLICMDKIVASTIASNADGFAFVSSKEVKEMILDSKDPETSSFFDENFK